MCIVLKLSDQNGLKLFLKDLDRDFPYTKYPDRGKKIVFVSDLTFAAVHDLRKKNAVFIRYSILPKRIDAAQSLDEGVLNYIDHFFKFCASQENHKGKKMSLVPFFEWFMGDSMVTGWLFSHLKEIPE